MPINDNGPRRRRLNPDLSDAHGQAALVLVESLIHGLIERSVLTTDDSIEIIDSAIEVQADIAEAADGAGREMWRSHAILLSMVTSLKVDADGSQT